VAFVRACRVVDPELALPGHDDATPPGLANVKRGWGEISGPGDVRGADLPEDGLVELAIDQGRNRCRFMFLSREIEPTPIVFLGALNDLS
jgi:hypothetical protein